MKPKIFIFGHRKQSGKNYCSDVLNKHLTSFGTVHQTYFAKKLKKICADKYNLDFSRMEDNDYKNHKPKWISPKVDGTARTVRDILIEEGCAARAIWRHTWSNIAYQEIIDSGAKYGIISDYRFPSEYSHGLGFGDIIRVLVYRPDGIFDNDGADGELPDKEDQTAWDFIIDNPPIQDWQENLDKQITTLIQSVI
jgi:hypothetical protein